MTDWHPSRKCLRTDQDCDCHSQTDCLNYKRIALIFVWSCRMVVEFIGSTGSGKTTLISEIKQKLSRSVCVSTSYELVTRRVGMQRVIHPTVKNLLQEIIGFPYFLRSMYRNKDFTLFTLKILARQSNFTIFTVNNLRSFERKMGVFEINKQKKQIK